MHKSLGTAEQHFKNREKVESCIVFQAKQNFNHLRSLKKPTSFKFYFSAQRGTITHTNRGQMLKLDEKYRNFVQDVADQVIESKFFLFFQSHLMKRVKTITVATNFWVVSIL